MQNDGRVASQWSYRRSACHSCRSTVTTTYYIDRTYNHTSGNSPTSLKANLYPTEASVSGRSSAQSNAYRPWKKATQS